MLTNELADLEAVLARIRIENHPQLDNRFVTAVLHAEIKAGGDDDAALQAIRRAVDEALDVVTS